MKRGFRIGVVIPAKNEEQFIEQVIQTLPQFVDLADVINDGSTDSTREILAKMDTTIEMHCIHLEGEGVGLSLIHI